MRERERKIESQKQFQVRVWFGRDFKNLWPRHRSAGLNSIGFQALLICFVLLCLALCFLCVSLKKDRDRWDGCWRNSMHRWMDKMYWGILGNWPTLVLVWMRNDRIILNWGYDGSGGVVVAQIKKNLSI